MALAPDFSARRAALTPRARAFSDHTTGRIWTFAEVDAEAEALAEWMRQFPSGARIGLLSLNRAEAFVALFAARKAGMVLCPLNWRSPLAELRGVAGQLGLAGLLHDAGHAGLGALLLPSKPRLMMRETGGFPLAAVLGPSPTAPVDDEAPWYLLLTSGTTGQPKAVIQTARMAQAVAVNLVQAMGLNAQDSNLCYLPLFHTAGINLFALPLFQWGGHSHILPRHDPDRIVALLKAGEITQLFGVPVIWQALADHPEIDHLGLDRLRGLASGGAVLPEALVTRLAAKGAYLRNGFGMTETGPTGFLMDKAGVVLRPRSVGKPQFLTEARIEGVADGAAGEGELLLRGATVTPGYFEDEAATEAAFRDGWLASGDVVRRDAEGYYEVIDRLKDLYISGGENVSPAEVEAVLTQHPAILEAAVVGKSDDVWGEVGCAFLRRAPGTAASDAEILDFCREQLAPYKVPKLIRWVEDFPRTASGKIQKAVLRAGL